MVGFGVLGARGGGGVGGGGGPSSPRGGTHLKQKKGAEKWLWAWGEDLEGGACSDNLYTFGPRPRRIVVSGASVRCFCMMQKSSCQEHRAFFACVPVVAAS